MKHTPGTWTVRANGDAPEVDGYVIETEDGLQVALVMMDEADREMNFANANLVGAAPELLAALEAVTSMHCTADGFYRDRINAMARAHAAIAQAKGGAA